MRARGTRSAIVFAIAAALVGTIALPAYAFDPNGPQATALTSGARRLAGSQSVSVGEVAAAVVARDTPSVTDPARVAAQKAAQAAAERATVAAQFAKYQSAYTGPTAADYLADPPYPSFSLAQVFRVAERYIGTPYVFGGATPAGFDCSGYVMFVYAQFGIALPHSVSGIAARGTRIQLADAVPGDLIVMPGHIGFYAGNGQILDAPDSGKSISIRPIWTSGYYVVRLGI